MKLSQKLIEKFELEEFYENFPAVIVNIKILEDNSQECIYISDNCKKYLGFSSEELANNWQIFLNRLNDNEKISLNKVIEEAAASDNKRLEFKCKFKTKDLNIKWIKLNANIIHRYNFIELQGIITDITEEIFSEFKEKKNNNALIHISRHPIIFEGNINYIGEFCCKLISETLDVPRSSFWIYNEEAQSIYCDKLYISKSNTFESGFTLDAKNFPEYFNAIIKKPYIIADNARIHSDTKSFTDIYFIPNDIYSLLDIPIFHNGKLLGVLCQEQVGYIRKWQKNEINFLFQLGDYISYCYAVSEKKIFEKELEFINKNLEILVEQKTNELLNKSVELEIKNKEIVDSVKYAKKIQDTILPEKDELDKSLSEYFIYYRPKDIVAGDFYWTYKTKNITLFAICDCTGHGIPGAFVSILAYKILRRVIKEFHVSEPCEILEKANNIFNEHFNKQSFEAKDGLEIGLISIETLNDKETFIKYSGAYIPLYIARNENDFIIEKISPNKSSIGFSPPETKYNQHQIKMTKGDILYMFSDGCYDQFGGAKGKKLKRKNLVDFIQKNIHQELNNQKDLVSDFLENWKGNIEQLDDICLFGLRF